MQVTLIMKLGETKIETLKHFLDIIISSFLVFGNKTTESDCIHQVHVCRGFDLMQVSEQHNEEITEK